MKTAQKTTRWLWTLLACLTLVAAACEPEEKTDAGEPEAASQGAEATPGDEAGDGEQNARSKPGTVAVAKDGTTFEPPVEKSKIPAGAWYCDMGTVHYARMEKGDGKCPECGMMLTHKAGAPAKKGAHEGHDHEGHEH